MEGIKSRLYMVGERINEIENREEEYKETKEHREKRMYKNGRILRELCDQSKWKNIQELRNKFRTEIKSFRDTMGGLKSRLHMVEEMINETEIREEEYKEVEAQREK